MAEMLVNSTKLDACLDAEADAIRAKTGDSNDVTFDFANNKGFADAIAAIPSGGGGGESWELHEVTGIVLASPTAPLTLLRQYISKCSQWCYFPTSASPQLSSIARGFTFYRVESSLLPSNQLGYTGSSAGNTATSQNVNIPAQYQVNDQSVSSTRQRGNVANIPSGTYTLKFFGVAYSAT